jgi:hypothetical protein
MGVTVVKMPKTLEIFYLGYRVKVYTRVYGIGYML